jgi:hypothetical protein
MSKPIVALLAVLALLVAFSLYRASLENYPVVWVNLFDECESSPDYGELIADGAITFLDAERTPGIRRIPHGTRVEVMSTRGDLTEIRLGTSALFVSTGSLSDYDPADGVRPDPTACAA